MINIKSVVTNSKLANPVSLSENNNCSKAFARVYKYLIDQGLMDNNSYALANVTSKEYHRIYSISSFDHKENFEKGMIQFKINDDEHTYYSGVGDRIFEREYKQANMMMKLPIDVVFKFKAKLQVKKPTIRIDSSFNITNLGGKSPINIIPKLQIRNLYRVPDSKNMWLGYLENGYVLMGFSNEWEADSIFNVINAYFKFKKKKITDSIGTNMQQLAKYSGDY